jgi:hypothetical protein
MIRSHASALDGSVRSARVSLLLRRPHVAAVERRRLRLRLSQSQNLPRLLMAPSAVAVSQLSL